MPQPDAVTASADEIIALFAAAQTRLETEQAEILTDPRQARRRRRVRQLLATIADITPTLNDATATWGATTMPAVYATGAAQVTTAAGWAWTQPHIAAVRVLAADTQASVLAATRFMTRDAKRWARTVTRELAASALIEGRTPTQVAREFARRAPADLFPSGRLPPPIRAVRYANGAHHTIDTYSHMLFRTVTAVAYNTGAVNAATAAGVEWFQAADGPGCKLDGHGDPGSDDVNGDIVPASVARAHAIAHPNCVRAWLPRPDITDPADATPLTPTGTP